MNRRTWIVVALAVLAAGFAISPASALMASPQKGRVISVFHPRSVQDGRHISGPAVQQMLRQGLKALTGDERPWSRWIHPGDQVGLKINTLGRPFLVTHPELIQAVIDELKEFGIKENRIIVWDRFEQHMRDARFVLNSTNQGVRYLATEGDRGGPMRLDEKASYRSVLDQEQEREAGSAVSRISTIFTQECDKIINMAILKDHVATGVTLCLKNLAFGITDNNNRFHGIDHVGPFIADICALPIVKKKVVLHILDGLEGCFNNGPIPRSPSSFFTPQTIWLGNDPVAVDSIGRGIIEDQRRAKGLPSLASLKKPVGYIELASTKGVGECNLDQISIEKISIV